MAISEKSIKMLIIAIAGLALLAVMLAGRADQVSRAEASGSGDTAKARAAFSDVAKVFFSPRCMNCHPGGDTPTQGDGMTTHTMDVKRGSDGRGVGELKCSTCHQDINLDGDNMPPGAPDWHMPGSEHKMSFSGISAGQLCRNLKDPLQNGGRQSAKDAVAHVSTDPKVLWAWNPGNGRTLPPLSQAEFLRKMNDWVANGAACPE